MKRLSPSAVLASMCLASLVADAAPRAPNLAVSIIRPGASQVGVAARYTVRVENRGNQSSAGTTLTIQLPVTHTSPTVAILGDLGARDGRCSVAGTRLTCAVPALASNRRADFYFDIALPYSAAPLGIDASAPLAGDSAPGNNSVSAVATPSTVALAVSPPRQTLTRHCTGTSLTSFFECEMFPSSIAEHETLLNVDHSITFLNVPSGYGGTWSQPAPNRLVLSYTNGTSVVAAFEGYGVDGACFEGRTTFPGSTSGYVSMYQVCLR